MKTGEELRRLRVAANLTLSQVARRGDFSKSHIGNVETGRRAVTRDVVAAYEAALGVSIRSSTSELSEILDTVGSAPVPPVVTLSDVLVIEQATEMLTAWDLERGGGPAGEMAKGQLRWAVSLLDGSMTDEVRKRLSGAIARLANRTGFSFFDIGEQASATRLSGLALRTAQDSQEADLTAHVLSDIASQAIHQGNPRKALAELDRVPDGIAPVMQFVVHGARALAYATMGDVTATWREVTNTEQAYCRVNVADLPDGFSPFVSGHAGHLYRDTGNALFALAGHGSKMARQEAMTRLTSAVELMGQGRTRAVVRSRARLALLLHGAGQRDEAAEQVRLARLGGAVVRSRRVAADLKRLDGLDC